MKSERPEEDVQKEEKLPTYSLPNTEVRELQSSQTGVDYILYVSLPHDYETESKKYPVLFLLDADYSFAIAHNVVEHFAQRNNIEDLVIVGIAYEGKSQDRFTYRINRVRDYSPTHIDSGVYSDEISAYSGGGVKFLSFIKRELIPYLEKNYRVSSDRGIVGHSLGGLFAAYTLIHSPTTFNRYIIVSPSLWYDDKMIFESDFSRFTSLPDSHINVFFAVGSYENQPQNGRAMVDDMLQLSTTLRRFNVKGIEINAVVFDNETHNSVFPGALTRGLRTVYN